MIAENGLEQQIPTQRYVQSLEEQSRKQRAAITVLERKLTRVEATLEQVKGMIGRNQ
jgi:capsule polysaccharide export protein KpsE/RkpR